MDFGSLIQAIASIYGQQAAQNMDTHKLEMLQQHLQDLKDLPLPDLVKVIAEQLGPTAMEAVHSDPQQREQQLEVMGDLRDMFEHGGFNVEDKAALNEALNRANVQGSAQRHALAGEFAQRGQLGAGARLAMGNMDAQNTANRSSQAAMDTAARGEQRRREALGQYGSMAGALRNQDFSEASARAQAHDAAQRWNASAREKAAYYNAGLPQQQFNNRVTKLTGQSAGVNNLAGAYGSEAQGIRDDAAGWGRVAGKAGNSLVDSLKGSGNGNNGPSLQSDDPNWTYSHGTDYGSSDPSEWENPYGGY